MTDFETQKAERTTGDAQAERAAEIAEFAGSWDAFNQYEVKDNGIAEQAWGCLQFEFDGDDEGQDLSIANEETYEATVELRDVRRRVERAYR